MPGSFIPEQIILLFNSPVLPAFFILRQLCFKLLQYLFLHHADTDIFCNQQMVDKIHTQSLTGFFQGKCRGNIFAGKHRHPERMIMSQYKILALHTVQRGNDVIPRFYVGGVKGALTDQNRMLDLFLRR